MVKDSAYDIQFMAKDTSYDMLKFMVKDIAKIYGKRHC